MNKPALLLLAACCAVASAYSQQIKLFTSEDRLSNSLINQVYQDTRGYIWIATEDGLNRFDGIDFTVYRSEETTLRNNYVHCVFEDNRGQLWVGCMNGLQRYSREDDEFVDIPLLTSAGDTVAAHVTAIAQDDRGDIWIATSGRGLMRLEGSVARTDKRLIGMSKVEFVNSITIDRHGYLWVVAARNGIYRCNVATGEVTFISIADGGVISGNAFIADGSSGLFLGSESNGLFRYDDHSQQFRKCNLGNDALVIAATCPEGEALLIGTDGSGILRYDIAHNNTEALDLFVPQLDFAKTKVHSIIYDRDGNLWLGLFQKGIMMIPRSLQYFISYGYRPGLRYNIGSGCVMSLFHSNGKLWVGTDSDGLYAVDNNGRSQHITGGVPSTIMAIDRCNANELWLAGYNEGLIRFDTRTNQAVDCNARLLKYSDSYNKRTTCLSHDNKGRLWLGTFGAGAFIVGDNGIKQLISTSEQLDYSRNEPVNNWINCITHDDDDIWIGTYRGICRYNTRIEAFVEIEEPMRNVVGQSVVYDVACGARGILWIATSKGLIYYNRITDRSVVYDKNMGLASNVTVSAIVDSADNVWVGTYGGISCVHNDLETIDNYYAHNGMQGNEYSRGAIVSDPQQNLYVGGLSGVTRFNPHVMTPDTSRPNIAITKFFLNGREITRSDLSGGEPVINEAVVDADTFAFSFAEKAFAFEFSTFNFVCAEQVSYEYRLEGFDDDWKALPFGTSQISFTNMPHGTYTFSVRARLGNVVSDIRSVTIIIAPMWWQTPWALLLYLAIAAIIGFIIWLFTRSRRRFKKELQEREHQRNIDEAKFQFFFNISHEIRTPLTLIINPIKQLMAKTDAKADEQKNYNLIYRNSMRILRLINQLLDIRKFDQGQMTMQFRRVDITAFIRDIGHSFDSMAEKKKINFIITSRLSDPHAAIDVNQFDKVIYNLYSNAFKFTPDEGTIETVVTDMPDTITITVTDTGIGISDEQCEKIFGRFYQVKDEKTASYVGTGIGLHLSRSIVQMHGGTIKAENCKQHHGATFTVTIPRNQAEVIEAEEQPTVVETHSEPILATMSDQSADSKPAPRASTNKRVLVVDDEPEVNNYLRDELQKTYRVTTCNNGREAYDTLLRQQFELVISDVMMPEMDGMTLCRKIKTNPNISYIPVILLTAKHSDEDRSKGLLIGADAYIAKPFDIDLLRATISNIIANRERIMSRFSEAAHGGSSFRPIELKSADEQLIEKVTAYIDENISDPGLNVEKLAAHVGMSRVHMHRKLKELTNQSARDFIKNIRLRQAGILLGEKKLNISEVAYALGFANLSHFSSTFKDFYGVSPKEYMNGKLAGGSSDDSDEEEEYEENT